MLAIYVVSKRNTCTSISRGDKTLKDGFQKIDNNGAKRRSTKKSPMSVPVLQVTIPHIGLSPL